MDPMCRTCNPRVVTVEPVMFLYMLSSFLQFPTFQALLYQKCCMEKYNDSAICSHLENDTLKTEREYVQDTTSEWIQYNNYASTIPAIFTVSLIIGPIGDKIGRKLPLILPIIGCIVYTVCNLVNAVFINAPISYLLIGSFANGIAGGFLSMMMGAYSYIGHVSSDNFRTIRIGIVESMIFLAGTIGFLISGVMLDSTSFIYVFSFIIGALVMALTYSVFWIIDIKPVSTPQSRHVQPVLEAVKETWMCITKSRSNRRTILIVLQISVICILQICTSGENDVLYLYTRLPFLSWSQSTYGYYKALESGLRGLTVLTLLPVLKRKLSMKDTSVAILGVVSKTVSMIVLGVSSQTWHVFSAAGIGMLQGFPSAGMRSMMSSMVENNEQGKLFAILASLESISSLIATAVYNNLYPATIGFYKGLCFLFAAALSVTTLTIILWLHFTLRGGQPYYRTLDDPQEERSVQVPQGVQSSRSENEAVSENHVTTNDETRTETDVAV